MGSIDLISFTSNANLERIKFKQNPSKDVIFFSFKCSQIAKLSNLSKPSYQVDLNNTIQFRKVSKLSKVEVKTSLLNKKRLRLTDFCYKLQNPELNSSLDGRN